MQKTNENRITLSKQRIELTEQRIELTEQVESAEHFVSEIEAYLIGKYNQ